MNNLSKEKKQQLMLIAMMTLILAGVIYSFVIKVQQKNVKLAKDKTEEVQAKVDRAQKTLKRGTEIQEELEIEQAELQERESSMASGDLYQWFLSKMIPVTSVRPLENFNANPPVLAEGGLLPKFPYRAAIYSVKLSGYYHDFGKFLADIENEFPYARIQNVDITAGPVGAGEKLNFSFDFVTLYHTNRTVTTR
jgi:Tfp pilus assembly protein PilO